MNNRKFIVIISYPMLEGRRPTALNINAIKN